MDINTIKKSKEVLRLIEVTEDAINGINNITVDNSDGTSQLTGYDGLYNLCISKENDGSGGGSAMGRYRGNAELLKLIKDTLARQLKEFQEEFDNL